jgi:tRNA(His) 5'-end guanylyltransferase
MSDSLGDRIKTNYERPATRYLTRRTPVVIRLDGRAFHTFTRNFPKPFSVKFTDAMTISAMVVAGEAQGFKLGYVQSDEASFLLTDYDELQTQPWFGYKQSKIESVSASIMTAAFARCMRLAGVTDLATFDARAFNVPEDEVVNYFLWRAQDWARNSLSMYAQAHFSHQELQGKNAADIHEMLHSIDRNWATDLMDDERNGTFLTPGGSLAEVLPTFTAINELWEQVKPKP